MIKRFGSLVIVITAAISSLCYGQDLCSKHVEGKEYNQAIEECTKKIENGADSVNAAIAHFNRGRAYYLKGQLELAIADYTKTIELNPQDAEAEAYDYRGDAYREKGQHDQAIRDYTKAIQLNPKYAMAYSKRGFVYYIYKKQYDQAIADYSKAVELNMKMQSLYHDLASLYSLTKNTAEACKFLRRSRDMGGLLGSADYIENDSEFDNIRNTSCYKEIMSAK